MILAHLNLLLLLAISTMCAMGLLAFVGIVFAWLVAPPHPFEE